MKRSALIATLALALLLCCSVCLAEEAKPETFTSGDYQYVLLEDGTAEIIAYTGEEAEVSIPDVLDGVKVTALGHSAFYNRDSLTGITIPDGITKMDGNPFRACRHLDTISVSPDHPRYAVIDNVLFKKNTRALVCYPAGKAETDYAVPEGITAIGQDAFSNCYNLITVAIPDTVCTINSFAFFSCANLVSLNIPDSVTEIRQFVFDYCYELMLTVGRDSYAQQYCEENGLRYTHPDSPDWLHN